MDDWKKGVAGGGSDSLIREVEELDGSVAEIYVDACDEAGCAEESADGSPARPYPTIRAAQAAARALAGTGYEGRIDVRIRAGTYALSEPLRLGSADTGGGRCQVAYRCDDESDGAEPPILSGGVAIADWEPWQNGIWRAKVPQGVRPRTLYADGARIDKARLPAVGYYETEPASERDGICVGVLPAGDAAAFEQAATVCAGMQAFVWPGEGEWNWFSETIPVRKADAEKRRIDFARPATWGIGGGSRYYLQGSLAFLREPGQFHFDEASRVLYYRPVTGTPLEQRVIAPALHRVVEIVGDGERQPVSGIALRGLELAFTDFYDDYRIVPDEEAANTEPDGQRNGLVYIRDADSVAIDGCRLRFSGSSGVLLDRCALNVKLTRNVVEHVGHHGIYAVGYAPGEGAFRDSDAANLNKGHLIADNEILHGGELVGHGAGIQLYQCGDCDIAHNRIAHMPRYGISMKGVRQGAMPKTLWGIPVTWDNHWDFLFARNNRIRHNDISDVMTDSQDGGMIESWGVGLGNLIRGNRLHHSGIRFSFGFGIYLDDASDGFTVTHNVLDHLYSADTGKLWMAIFAKGIGNVIANNLIVDNPAAVNAIGTQEMVGEANRELAIERNIVSNAGRMYGFVNWRPERLARADRNLYWNGGAPRLISGELPEPAVPLGENPAWGFDYDWETWLSVSEGRFEANSVVADPLFASGEEGGYRLRPDSPAYGLGWEDIDWSLIGPRRRQHD
ncbi:right-handed parallel beta-helix repeat-containing protein [Cohnella hashimotonis]|uniref:Right-handed parallel beta-helix repeat-containing protein n=1 Tax=Cohnella hashimotonis TaxID=2826895 RepID=A0ABT6TEI3_9BACL|nr:right-handed parallel beta-helix repeat-containing protein [Cohnella hashimotonis]MDI4645095.1 right-handed parallel beta-helix repeat-containing protein [Cohnella hashimotonis]